MKKLKIPNNVKSCVKLLSEHFPREYCRIRKSVVYFPHSEKIETIYSVQISGTLGSFRLESFEAVRKYIELAILNKDGE